MYPVLTYLACVALVFVIATFFFILLVSVLIMGEALKFIRQKASTALSITSRPLASAARPAAGPAFQLAVVRKIERRIENRHVLSE